MRLAFFGVILVHGLIHLMGFAKAFKLAELSDLKLPVTRPAGVAWLTCALALAVTAVLFLVRQEAWWWVATAALIASQTLIFGAWRDARFGTLVNLILAVPVVLAALESRPGSYASQYRAAVCEGLARRQAMPPVTETDLAGLPAPVQRYLRYAGAVGKPRIHHFRAVFTGEFRNGLKSRWMGFRSEQYDFLDEPSRIFLMKASVLGLPLEGLHLYRGDGATMRIEMASLFQLVDAAGPEMNQGETVTLFNDLCVMAPASLIDRGAIEWEALSPLKARARYTRRGLTITAELTFRESGELADFVSSDRFLSADGKTYASYPWSTPVHAYRDVDGRRVASDAELVWHMPAGDFTYGRFRLDEIEYNLAELK